MVFIRPAQTATSIKWSIANKLWSIADARAICANTWHSSQQVVNPWQIKFAGKLVVFYQQPDIAFAFALVNTSKTFEPYLPSSKLSQTEALPYAIDNALPIGGIIGVKYSKIRRFELVYDGDDTNGTLIRLPSTQFIARAYAVAMDDGIFSVASCHCQWMVGANQIKRNLCPKTAFYADPWLLCVSFAYSF